MKAGNQIIIFGSQENESKNEAVLVSDDYFDQYVKTGQTPINKPSHNHIILSKNFVFTIREI
jgi:hypothetical protein